MNSRNRKRIVISLYIKQEEDEKVREKFQRFMIGRYGNDKMNQVLSGVSFVLVLIGAVAGAEL